MEPKIIGVPSGIGDLSWLYSKLKHIGQPLHLQLADGWPRRSMDFVKMLPNVQFAEYTPHSFTDIMAWEKSHPYTTWADIKARGFGGEFLQNNMWLLAGRRLDEWLPDLPTDYHYDFTINEDDRARAAFLWDSNDLGSSPTMCLSAASYRGSEAWNTWGIREWRAIIELVKQEVPDVKMVLVGGYWDDLTSTLADTGNFVNFVGKANIGATIDLLSRMTWYMGFQSGLGVMRTVMRQSYLALWPDIHASHINGWVDPEQLESGEYTGLLWRDPQELWPTIRKWINNHATLSVGG